MPKFYAVEIKTVAIVQVGDDEGPDDAQAIADDLSRTVINDALDLDLRVIDRVQSIDELGTYGWDVYCIPYNGDSNTPLRDLLPAKGDTK